MKKVLVFCVLVALWLSLDGSGAWAFDVGWMQKGVRVWYFGAAGTGMSSDAEEAYLFTSINGNTAQLTHHSGINHWSLPTAETKTGSILGKGPFWIHPQVLQTIAIGDNWMGIDIKSMNRATYTYDTFKNTGELSSLPYLLLPIKALFDLQNQREVVKLVYGNPNYPDYDPVWGTAYFDADTGLCLFNLRLTVSNIVWFILSEINYDFATHRAFAEDNGPHTGFKSTVLKTKSAIWASHFVQILSSVESRYGGTVQMWTTTQAGGASGSYFGRDENYCFFGSVPLLRHKLMTATPNYPPEGWNEYGEYLWWWVPTDALQKLTINVFGVPMTRTSTAPYTFAGSGGTGLFFSKLIFDNDGYITDFSAKDPSIGLDLDLGSLIDLDITVDGLAYYRNTMGIATPAKIEMVDFVTEYYNDILDRAPEPGGAESWTAEIDRIMSLGIDIKEGFIAVGKGFFNSNEYLSMKKSDTDYILDLYRAFLNRTPSQAEINFHLDYMAQGVSRNEVLNNFIFSPEFGAYVEGIFGVSVVGPENILVNDFYRGILSRLPDTVGFNYWLGQMRGAQCAGSAQQIRDLSHQIALGFIQSTEYLGLGRTDGQFLEDLYDAVLRRAAAPWEINYWLTYLGTATRGQALQGFTDSNEFQIRVTEVIDAGCF